VSTPTSSKDPASRRSLTARGAEGRLGDYHLLRKIGEGGMGAIFLAKRLGVAGFEKTFVLKVMLDSLAGSEEFVAMFFDEARLAARLTHPNIAQVHDFGVIDGNYYYAMEHIPGEDLSAIIGQLRRRKASIPVGIALRIMVDVCAGLDYAHTLSDGGQPLSIIHRDISPSNVMVSYQGAVKLLDFGIAKAASRVHATHSRGMKGKLAYLAPEQVQGQAIDARADLFSLGITFYSLVTERHPFRRDSQLATMHAIVHEETPDPRSEREDLPEEIAAIIHRSLAREPDRRYQSAAEMGAELQAAMAQIAPGTGGAELTTFMISLFGKATMEARSQVPTLAEVNLAELLNSRGELAAVGAGANDGATVVQNPLEHPTLLERPVVVRPAPKPPRRRWLWPAAALGVIVLAGVLAMATRAGGRAGERAAPPHAPLTGPASAAPATRTAVVPLPPRPPPPAPPAAEETPAPAATVPPAPAPDQAKPRLRAGRPPAPLDRQTLQTIVKRAHPRFAACFKSHSGDLPGDAGQVTVELAVAGSGKVSAAHAALAGSSALARCLEQEAGRLRFPGHPDRELRFSFPLAYRKGGR
jgi:serine/threonine-protein kinase